MSRNKLYLFLGVLIMIMPFLGLPALIKTMVFVAIGFIMVLISVIAHTQRRSEQLAEPHDSSVV